MVNSAVNSIEHSSQQKYNNTLIKVKVVSFVCYHAILSVSGVIVQDSCSWDLVTRGGWDQ